MAFLLVGRFYGFVSGSETGPNPGEAAKFLMAIFPFVVMALSAIAARFLHFPPNENEPAGEGEGAAPEELPPDAKA